ncbi:hypothetical protein AwDysgo_18610 [Bacteroidales bacterium]|nr:hypothetical protein AwDysgo_18610 [Bacteroidales bacterium]
MNYGLLIVIKFVSFMYAANISDYATQIVLKNDTYKNLKDIIFLNKIYRVKYNFNRGC